MSFSDRLSEFTDSGSTGAQSEWVKTPSGWEAGIKYEPDGSRIVTTAAVPETDDYAGLVEKISGQIPDGYRVRLAEARVDPAAWHRDGEGEDAVTRPIVRYRFVVELAPKSVPIDDLLKAVGRRRGSNPVSLGDSVGTYLVAAGDLQLGKPDGGGTAATIDRVIASHEASLDRYKALRKRGIVDEVVLPWLGDCIEGTNSQGGNLIARLDITITEAVRVYRRLMMRQVTDYAKVASKVTVAVVPGNHDEAVRMGNQMATRYDDSWAIEGASQVADAMELAGYDNVTWVFPGIDELDLCIDIAGTRIGLLHGHQTKGKMETWLGGAAVQRRAIGTADVVLSGHYHHLKIQQIGPTTHIQVPAMDGGSLWWRHKGGTDAPPGMVTAVLNNGWRGLEIL